MFPLVASYLYILYSYSECVYLYLFAALVSSQYAGFYGSQCCEQPAVIVSLLPLDTLLTLCRTLTPKPRPLWVNNPSILSYMFFL